MEDGFGTVASAFCSECGCRSVYVCKLGDIRCGVCYDGNPKEYYGGTECMECTMDAVHGGKCACCGDDG